jgi:hypothetical protein
MTVSCKKDDPVTPYTEDIPVAVQFSSNIGKPDGKTLAAGENWESGDAIGVFMVNNGSVSVNGAAANKKYTTAGAGSSGNFTSYDAANTIYYPVNGNKVDFIAYYPYASSIAARWEPYSVDVSTQTAPAAIDLLYATANNGGAGYNTSNSSPVALAFNHKLSKLTLNISSPEGAIPAADLAAMTVSIAGLNTKGAFNLANGTLGSASNKAPITPRMVTAGAQYEAILLPGTFTGVTVTFTITAGSAAGAYVWNVPDGAFDAGKEYIHNVVITGDRDAISVTGTIDDWEVVNGTGPNFD